MDGTWSLACPPGAVVGVRSLAEHQSHVGSGGSRFLQGRNAGQPNRVWQQLSTVFVKIATIKIAAMADCFLEAGNPAKAFLSASFSPPQFPLTCEKKAEESAADIFTMQPVHGIRA